MPSSSGKRLSEAEWLRYKPTIRRLIQEQKLSQVKTRQFLKEEGFLVTKHDLETKLKSWRFCKRVRKNEAKSIWQFIGHRITKRKHQGKNSVLVLNKQVYDLAKMTKSINRHQQTSLEKYGRCPDSIMSPKTPPDLDYSIYTPREVSNFVSWPNSLPWVRFQPKLSGILSSLGLAESFVGTVALREWDAHGNQSMFASLLQVPLRIITDGAPPSILASQIGTIMPEVVEDENAGRAQLLRYHTAEHHLQESIKVIFYSMSNNFGDTQEFLDHWGQICTILEISGITKMSLKLDIMEDDTVKAVAERLFRVATQHLCTCGSDGLENTPTWRIIHWLLESGQDPNIPIPHIEPPLWAHVDDPRVPVCSTGQRLTPLQAALRIQDHASPKEWTSLVCQLLDAGAKPNLTYDWICAPLWFAVHQYRFVDEEADEWVDAGLDVVKRLLAKGASINWIQDSAQTSVLLEALRLGHLGLDLIDVLVQNGANMRQRVHFSSTWFNGTRSAFGYVAEALSSPVDDAAESDYDDAAEPVDFLQHLLKRERESDISTTLADFIAKDDVLIAASNGCSRILGLFYSHHIDIRCTSDKGISALHLAAFYGHVGTCKWLLKRGLPVDGQAHPRRPPSPLYLAAYRDHLDVVKLLHQHQAEVNYKFTATNWGPPFCDPDQYAPASLTSPMAVAILAEGRQTYGYLADCGVQVPDWAVCWGAHAGKSSKLVQFALERGVNPNWKQLDGLTALQLALTPQFLVASAARTKADESAEIAILLLRYGAVLTGGELQGALLLRNWELIHLILERDNTQIWCWKAAPSLMEAAVISRNVGLADLVSEKTSKAYDPYALCARVGQSTTTPGIPISLLLENRPESARTHALEALAIGVAAFNKDVESFQLLLEEFETPELAPLPTMVAGSSLWHLGADVIPKHLRKIICEDCKLEDNRPILPFWYDDFIYDSPLVLALWSERLLLRMLKHGYQPDRLTLFVAVKIDSPGILRTLLRGPRLHDGFETISGPLWTAVESRNTGAIQIFLETGEDVNEDNTMIERGRSPLQQAVEQGDLSMIDLLIEKGADINAPAARSFGATTLQLAAITGRIGIVRSLIDLGANINAPGAVIGGRTALEGAAEHGRIDVTQYLLVQGAQTGDEGRLQYVRAVRYAEIEGHLTTAKLLRAWREWMAADDALWNKLRNLSKKECEEFTEETCCKSHSDAEPEADMYVTRGEGILTAEEFHLHQVDEYELLATAHTTNEIVTGAEDWMATWAGMFTQSYLM